MDLITNKKDCCGCGVCYNICPKKAIKMQEDECGYIYPEIDKNKCIDCGLCKKMCIYQNKEKKMYEPIETYAAITNQKELIRKSASGGIFANIAQNIIENNGVVYGCSMEHKNENLQPMHIRVDTINDLEKLQGSKYIQSDMGTIYKEIKKDLEQNKVVLFSGTPCQAHALRSYLNFKSYNNLFIIDIICHGVPNSKMFNDYLETLRKKVKGKIIDFKFRDKTKNWGLFASVISKQNEKKYKKIIPSFESSYYQLFLDSMIYRENCYECPYANKERIGDITIGDFWKVEVEHSDYIRDKKIDINNGVSCFIVNNTKGKELIEKFSKNIELYDSIFDKVSKHNAQLLHPSNLKSERNEILELYKKRGYESIDSWYKKNNMLKIIIKKIWYKLPLKFRSKLRK